MNDQAKATNKTIVSELKRHLREANGAWVDELMEVLWGYHCTPHDTTWETPFNLTYGTDVMLPVKVGESTIKRRLKGMSMNEEQLQVELDTL